MKKSHEQSEHFYDTEIPVFKRTEKKPRTLMSRFAWIAYALLGGYVFTLWSPLWFGPPSDGRVVTGIIYLFALTAWLPMAMGLISSGERKRRRTFIFLLVAFAWGISVLTTVIGSVTTVSLVSPMEVTQCEEIDGQHHCVLATCQPNAALRTCAANADGTFELIGSYTLEQVGSLPLYRIVHKQMAIDWFGS